MKNSYFQKNGLLVALLFVSFGAKAQETPALDTAAQKLQEQLAVADTSKVLETEIKNTSTAKEETVNIPSDQSNNSKWIPLILSLLSLGGVAYLFFTRVDKKQIGTKADFYKKDFEAGAQKIHQEISELKVQQAALVDRIQALETAATAAIIEVPEPEPEPVVAEPTEDQVPSPLQTWYSVAPKNGIFFARQLGDTFKAREHIYRIEVLDEAQAYYYLVDDSATRQHAFNIPDSYILPAMEIDGTGRLAEASQVDIQRGSLVKAGNNWQIEEKAILNYSI